VGGKGGEGKQRVNEREKGHSLWKNRELTSECHMALMESATWHFLLSISRTLKNVSMEMRMVDRNGS